MITLEDLVTQLQRRHIQVTRWSLLNEVAVQCMNDDLLREEIKAAYTARPVPESRCPQDTLVDIDMSVPVPGALHVPRRTRRLASKGVH